MRPSVASALLLAAGTMAALASAGDTATRAVQRLVEASPTRAVQRQPGTPAPERASNADTRRIHGSGIGRILRGAPWPSREGWTNARYQRVARKARNVQRNRKAHRG